MAATLQSRLPQIAAELRPRVSKAVRDGAEDIASAARDRVPVRTGALRDAIAVKRAGAAQARVVAGDLEVFYGRFVEFGTERMPAQAFLLPAAESEHEPVVDRVIAVLRGL